RSQHEETRTDPTAQRDRPDERAGEARHPGDHVRIDARCRHASFQAVRVVGAQKKEYHGSPGIAKQGAEWNAGTRAATTCCAAGAFVRRCRCPRWLPGAATIGPPT